MTSALRQSILTGLALLLILLGAGGARFIDLATNPGGLYPDEAAEAMSARQILRDATYRPVFIAEDGGREALYAYTVAAGFAVAGDSVVTLRAVAALWGVMGVLAIWLLARRFGRGAGLAAAAWAAGSLWLIAISRDGMRNTITPFFCAIAFIALLAWVDRPSRRTAIVAGAIFALSTLYTYQALKLLPLLGIVWLLWLRRVDRTTYQRLLGGAVPFLVSFAIVAAPMIAAAFADLPAYLGRGIGVMPFNPALVPGSDPVTHVLRTLGMFAFVGDPNPRHDVNALPLLDWAVLVLALPGLVSVWRHRALPSRSLILLAIPVFLLPPLIATEGDSPHFLRALGLAAPIAVAVGVGSQAISERVAAAVSGRLRAAPVTGRMVSVALFAALFVSVGSGSVATYLGRPVQDRYAAFSYDLVALAGLAHGPRDAVIVDDFEALTIRFVGDLTRPTIVRPGPIDATAYDRVLAIRVGDLRTALGETLAATAVAVARDPAGHPTVWLVKLR
ncbi:MAG: glycosyltransferase family 39 protein [Chloroflexi bacterium]|nr:glycosyltransferase family 39 protein [Chloroflexota bacterium]